MYCSPSARDPGPLRASGRRSSVRSYLALAVGRSDSRLPNSGRRDLRSEEHTSELQSLMRISYAVFCLKKKTEKYQNSKKPKHTISINEQQGKYKKNNSTSSQ